MGGGSSGNYGGGDSGSYGGDSGSSGGKLSSARHLTKYELTYCNIGSLKDKVKGKVEGLMGKKSGGDSGDSGSYGSGGDSGSGGYGGDSGRSGNY